MTQYKWISREPLADVPDWLASNDAAQERPEREGEDTARETVLGEAFSLAGMLGPVLDNGIACVKCPWWEEHSDGRGRGNDSSTVILPPAGGSRFGGFKCAHSHCSTRTWSDVIAALPKEAVAAAKAKYPIKLGEAKGGSSASSGNDKDRKSAVRQMLAYKELKSGGYAVVADLVNLQTLLTYDPDWVAEDGKPLLRFDYFTRKIVFHKEPPWHPDDKPRELLDYWTDGDVARLSAWCKRYWNVNMTKELIVQAVETVSERWGTHQVRDWLNTLEWDGVPRVDKWMTLFLGVEDNAYTNSVGRWWMISAVARAMEPGCKADYVLILEGEQGLKKSTALEILASKPWFNDTPFVIGDKDGYLGLNGKWIVELAELDNLSRADSSAAKAFFASKVDNYRKPYGRIPEAVPRCCVFAGSVNLDAYLKDPTGNRRYWPVRCTKIDLAALEADRVQLWAEALHLYRRGERWWPEGQAENELCRQAQAQREEEDSWTPAIDEWINSEEGRKFLALNDNKISPGQLMEYALGIDVDRQDKHIQGRIGAVVKKLGWERTRVRVGKTYPTFYVPVLDNGSGPK